MRWRVGASLIGFLFLSVALGSPLLAKPPKQGIVREYYPNGRLQLEVRYKNGQEILRRQYGTAGQLLLDYRYREGQPYYKRVSYPNGRMRSLWTKKSGVLINYYRDGRIKAIVKSKGLSIEQP